MKEHFDLVILGAGAAGLMCAITAAKRGRSVLILEKSNKIGKKILMSGGGRCNFTNLFVEPEQFISENPHFCKSALKAYTPEDFISLVESHEIEYVEKKHHQLFCKGSSKEILNMLIAECKKFNVGFVTDTDVRSVQELTNEGSSFNYQIIFDLNQIGTRIFSKSLVVATGALSIPTLGGSGFGYELAKQFKLPLVIRQASLVPFMFSDEIKNICEDLSGLSTPVVATCNKKSFQESMLFTHRGLSGPAILQISNYWKPGDEISIDLLPNLNAENELIAQKKTDPNNTLKRYLGSFLPKALISQLEELWWPSHQDRKLAEISGGELRIIGQQINSWKLKPSSTEGYRTAEVTLGGVNTNSINSQSMEVKDYPGLFFIGEVLDVTGHLGGYNFQWAWSSGYCAGLVA